VALDTNTSAEKKHAKFSASGSDRWLNCPGSMVLSESAPDRPDSEYAKEGTQAHECLELLLKNENQLAAAKRMALKKYPLDMVEYALDAVYWITDRVGEGEELLCETEVRLDYIEPDMFGTLDAAIVRHFGRLTVIDYKYGSGLAVEPSYNDDCNSQLAYYALGIANLYDFNFSEVELVVIQPRAYHESGETVRSAVFPIEKLYEWEQKFKDGVAHCKAKEVTYAAGNWCRFCPAAVICPELKERAMDEAQIVFNDDAGLISLPKPELIPTGRGLAACDKIEAWIESYRKLAVEMLSKGHEIDGYKLVQKRSVRKWVNSDEVIQEALKRWNMKAFTQPKLLSPKQFEDTIGDKDFVAKNTTKESSGTTLVPSSDKRQAVIPVENVFPELP